ncbi:hypothetical protein AVEN_126718-1 [Araneus ventricosus]|uniref:Uncharacterized protein n=1 Tax=Araneus ventricosus TaxID=182803 RepID=A0A4Y2VK75_ARAVE|nr:hypothetical protein AVEN_126718-1 [Araneus ventricosus]
MSLTTSLHDAMIEHELGKKRDDEEEKEDESKEKKRKEADDALKTFIELSEQYSFMTALQTLKLHYIGGNRDA